MRAREVSRRDFIAGAGATAGGIALFGLSACGKADRRPQRGERRRAPTRVSRPLRIYDEIISATAFKIAAAQGYFTDEELNLQSVSFPGGSDVVRAIQSKMAFGQAGTIPTIIAHEKAMKDMRMISGSYYDPEVVFLVTKDSPLKSAEDLKGKKVGVSEPGSNSTYFATKMLTDAGLKPNEDTKIVSVGGPSDAATAADQGVVDVAWSTPPLATKEVLEGKKRLLLKPPRSSRPGSASGLSRGSRSSTPIRRCSSGG